MVETCLIDDISVLIANARCGLAGVSPSNQVVTVAGIDASNPVSHIECVIAHSCCGSDCVRSVVVELWSLRLRRRSADERKGLAPIFLKNAIRSHLHFSQLNSWIANEDSGLSKDYICTYRVTRHPAISKMPDGAISVHEFPVCEVDARTTLSVSVQYIKKQTAPLPVGPCFKRLDPITTDQWLLPSPVGSPLDLLSLAGLEDNTSYLKHKHTSDSSLSPDGPAPKFPAYSSTRSNQVVLPARRAIVLSGDEEEVSVDLLVNTLNSALSSRGRPRAKSGGSFLLHQTAGVALHHSPIPRGRQRNSLSACEVGMPERKRNTPSTGLLGSFEECALNGRLDPVTHLDGFMLQLAASGSFSSPHVTLPVQAFFFDLNDAVPLPCLGTCRLDSLGRRGYRVPKQGTIQATLFNPLGTVIKVFLAPYDVSDMPPSSQTFIRQRTVLSAHGEEDDRRLQHLIHLRLATDRRGRVFVHTDIRVLFSQNSSLDGLNVELKGHVGVESGKYKQCSETKMPISPKYSPKK